MSKRIEVVDNLDLLLEVVPNRWREKIEASPRLNDLIEIVFDLGRKPEARFPDDFVYLSDENVTSEDLEFIVDRVGEFNTDNRAGIERTLHRISAIRNRRGEIIGLTCRVGRAVFGTIDIIRDVVESGRSTLLLGRPGVGKTTMLREVARVLADEFKKRVVIVDTSNEIAGDGDIPHPAIGRARRMQVARAGAQAEVMIEAVENHMPEVIVIDEIGKEAEAEAARTIAERGVQLIGTAHGNTLENLVLNPTLSDLVGGIQAVTLGDEEARKRGTQKTVLERKSPPTFDVVIELQSRVQLAIHHDVGKTVDLMLRGMMPEPEVRQRTGDGNYEVIASPNADDLEAPAPKKEPDQRRLMININGETPTLIPRLTSLPQVIRIFPYAVSRNRLEKAIQELRAPVHITKDLNAADMVLTLKGQYRKMPKKIKQAEAQGVPIQLIRSNTQRQITDFLRTLQSGDQNDGYNS